MPPRTRTEADRAADRRRYEAKKAEGVCAQCGRADVAGRVHCAWCREGLKLARKTRDLNRKWHAMCVAELDGGEE